MKLKTRLLQTLLDYMYDNNLTPYLGVAVTEKVIVPQEYVTDNGIILNISPKSVVDFELSDKGVSFTATFSGHAFDINVPLLNIISLRSKETAEGLDFDDFYFAEEDEDQEEDNNDDNPFKVIK